MADGVGNLFVWTGEADITYSVADSGWEFMSGYYPLALQQIADNPWGEAMMPRLRIRLLNGSNYFVDSDGFFSSPDWPDTGNLINVQSTPSGDPAPFGTSTLLITNATATTAEYIYQSRTLEDRDRFVFWVLVHVYSTGAGRV